MTILCLILLGACFVAWLNSLIRVPGEREQMMLSIYADLDKQNKAAGLPPAKWRKRAEVQ